MQRFAAGDEVAFELLHERYRALVLAVSMGVVGTPHDADDVTQETFSTLAQALLSTPPQELRPWLIRVARNASIDLMRRRRHRLLTIDGELPEIPAREASHSGEFEAMIRGIGELPENQRAALLMREMGGRSYSEIADELKTDEESVRGLIARARTGLRGYREATELPCAVARAEIDVEPDGRRYGRAVRRHLKFCSSCRQHRNSLRGDARSLRAGLPLHGASAIGKGGLSAGAFGAAKASFAGLALTQIAATCAASVCAFGTVGGIVMISNGHQLLGFGFGRSPLPAHVSARPRPATRRLADGHSPAAQKAASDRALTPPSEGRREIDWTTQLAGPAYSRWHPNGDTAGWRDTYGLRAPEWRHRLPAAGLREGHDPRARQVAAPGSGGNRLGSASPPPSGGGTLVNTSAPTGGSRVDGPASATVDPGPTSAPAPGERADAPASGPDSGGGAVHPAASNAGAGRTARADQESGSGGRQLSAATGPQPTSGTTQPHHRESPKTGSSGGSGL